MEQFSRKRTAGNKKETSLKEGKRKDPLYAQLPVWGGPWFWAQQRRQVEPPLEAEALTFSSDRALEGWHRGAGSSWVLIAPCEAASRPGTAVPKGLTGTTLELTESQGRSSS